MEKCKKGKKRKLDFVDVHYSDGTKISTSMNPNLKDSEVKYNVKLKGVKMTNSKEFKEVNLVDSMAKKRRIKGECYEVREKNTSAGRKGTIIRKCPKKSQSYVKAKEALKRLRRRT